MKTTIIEVRQVQAYLSESNRLSQMRGASRALVAFDTTVEDLAKRIGRATAVTRAGSHLEYEVPDDAVEEFLANVTREFEEITGLGRHRLIGVAGTTRDEAADLARSVKGTVPPPALPHSLVRPCPVCRVRPIESSTSFGPAETLRVCRACERRQVKSRGAVGDLWDRIGGTALSESASLTGFADRDRSPGYVGVLVADGDRIGSQIGVARNFFEGSKLSDYLKNATVAATGAAIAAVEAAGGSRPAALPLWVGGDDATIVFPACFAFDAAIAFARSFATALDPILETVLIPPFSASSGLVIGKASHPIHDLIGLARDLQTGAKMRMRAWRADNPMSPKYVGAVDFEVVTASHTGSLAYRRSHTRLRPLLIARARSEDDNANGMNPQAPNVSTLEHWLGAARTLVVEDAPRGLVRNLSDASPDADPGPDVPETIRDIINDAAQHERRDTLREIYEVVRS